MKREFLAGLGMDKELIDKVMAEHGKTIESHKAVAENAVKDRDTYKGQLDEVSEKLKAFDGVDIEALRGEVEALKTDMATKETDFQNQLADRDFQALISAGIAEAKGKNPKAIAALLDTDKLKTSKNQKEDIVAAIKALAESDAYLFGETSNKSTGTPAKVSTGATHDENGGSTAPNNNAAMNDMIRGNLRGE